MVGGQFVEDTFILSLQLLFCCLAAARRLHPDAVELHAGAQRKALRTFRCLEPGPGVKRRQSGSEVGSELMELKLNVFLKNAKSHISYLQP